MTSIINRPLFSLLARGDYVAIEHGRLMIASKSGRAVPSDWFAAHQAIILGEIAQLTGIAIFQYQDYTTGRYGRYIAQGVRLNYLNIATGQTCPVFFNADLTRSRTSKRGNAKQDLPKGQFRPGKALMKYWEMLGLARPRYASEYHYRMGRLRDVLVTAETAEDGKIDKASIQPCDVSHEELKVFIQELEPAGKVLGRNWEGAGKLLGRTTEKEIAETQTQQGFAANLSTCASQHEISNQEGTYNVLPDTTLYNPINQSVDEWLSDYSSIPEHPTH